MRIPDQEIIDNIGDPLQLFRIVLPHDGFNIACENVQRDTLEGEGAPAHVGAKCLNQLLLRMSADHSTASTSFLERLIHFHPCYQGVVDQLGLAEDDGV